MSSGFDVWPLLDLTVATFPLLFGLIKRLVKRHGLSELFVQRGPYKNGRDLGENKNTHRKPEFPLAQLIRAFHRAPLSRRVPGSRFAAPQPGENCPAPHHGQDCITLHPQLNMQRVTQGTAVPPQLPPPPAPALNMQPSSSLAYRPTWRGGRMADTIPCSAAEFQILSLLETIKHQNDQLTAKVNLLTSRMNSTPGPDVEMPDSIQFPLEQLEAVEAFEQFLKEPSNGPARQRVISSLANIGGQDVKRVTWNILGRLFTDEFPSALTMGAILESGYANTSLGAVRKNVVTRSATDAEVTKHARWFNLAADRAARRRVPPPSTPPPNE
ncbi:unnamed protein product [Arctogadus glacialis]